eukprot:450242-Pyramimonas_sp.AAC.1
MPPCAILRATEVERLPHIQRIRGELLSVSVPNSPNPPSSGLHTVPAGRGHLVGHLVSCYCSPKKTCVSPIYPPIRAYIFVNMD